MSSAVKIVTILYLVVLASVMGAGIYAGAVVAPVTFNSSEILGAGALSRYQEGIIMTENFVRLSYAVVLAMVFVVLFEFYRFARIERDAVSSIAAVLVVATAGLFSFHFVPEIVALQQVGEAMTQEPEFRLVHEYSETNFKLFVFATLVLLVRNLHARLR